MVFLTVLQRRWRMSRGSGAEVVFPLRCCFFFAGFHRKPQALPAERRVMTKASEGMDDHPSVQIVPFKKTPVVKKVVWFLQDNTACKWMCFACGLVLLAASFWSPERWILISGAVLAFAGVVWLTIHSLYDENTDIEDQEGFFLMIHICSVIFLWVCAAIALYLFAQWRTQGTGGWGIAAAAFAALAIFCALMRAGSWQD